MKQSKEHHNNCVVVVVARLFSFRGRRRPKLLLLLLLDSKLFSLIRIEHINTKKLSNKSSTIQHTTNPVYIHIIVPIKEKKRE